MNRRNARCCVEGPFLLAIGPCEGLIEEGGANFFVFLEFFFGYGVDIPDDFHIILVCR